MVKIDNFDKELLRELQDNAKQTSQQLSKKLGKPRTTIVNRIKRLESAGVIKKYQAILDPKKVGKTLVAFFYIEGPRVEGPTSPKFDVENIGLKLAKIPHIQEVYSVVGERDYMLKGYYDNIEDYFELSKEIAKYAKTGGGVLVSKVYKESSSLTLE